MKTDFTFYIDESGEAGISKVRGPNRKGASPYMTLGGVLIPNVMANSVQQALAELQSEISVKSLHCSYLKHRQKVRFARMVSNLQVRCFGVISKKSTLGAYADEINSDSKKYYNKCGQYLLERLGAYIGERGISPHTVDIVFEKGNFDYQALRGLIRACQSYPHNNSVRLLRNIHVPNITAKAKDEDRLLSLADLVAHSLYLAVEKNEKNFGIPEPRYLEELGPRFYGDRSTGDVLGYGIKCVHSVREIKFDADVEKKLRALKMVS